MSKKKKKSNKTKSVDELVREGVILLQRGRHKQALEPLQEVLNREPNNFDATLNLSAALILDKKYKVAIPLLEKLIKVDPENAMIWTNLGACYLGNPVLADDAAQHKAVDAFVHALDIDPAAPNVAYNIGLIHKDRNELDVALKWFQLAAKTNPQDQDALYWIQKIAKK